MAVGSPELIIGLEIRLGCLCVCGMRLTGTFGHILVTLDLTNRDRWRRRRRLKKEKKSSDEYANGIMWHRNFRVSISAIQIAVSCVLVLFRYSLRNFHLEKLMRVSKRTAKQFNSICITFWPANRDPVFYFQRSRDVLLLIDTFMRRSAELNWNKLFFWMDCLTWSHTLHVLLATKLYFQFSRAQRNEKYWEWPRNDRSFISRLGIEMGNMCLSFGGIVWFGWKSFSMAKRLPMTFTNETKLLVAWIELPTIKLFTFNQFNQKLVSFDFHREHLCTPISFRSAKKFEMKKKILSFCGGERTSTTTQTDESLWETNTTSGHKQN